MSQRIKKVNELVKQEISKILLKKIDLENILVTINDADTSPDLKNCKIKISIIPKDKSSFALEIIQKRIYHIQQEFNKKLHLKYTPKLSFEIDQIETKAQRIEELLSKSKT